MSIYSEAGGDSAEGGSKVKSQPTPSSPNHFVALFGHLVSSLVPELRSLLLTQGGPTTTLHPACDPLKALPKNTQLGIAGGVLVALALLVYLGPSGDVNEPARVAAPVNHGFSSDRDVASCALSKNGATKVIDSGCWGTLATMTSASESNALTDVGINPNAAFSGVSSTPRVSTLNRFWFPLRYKRQLNEKRCEQG